MEAGSRALAVTVRQWDSLEVQFYVLFGTQLVTIMGEGLVLSGELPPLLTLYFRVSLSFFMCKMEIPVPSLTTSQE